MDYELSIENLEDHRTTLSWGSKLRQDSPERYPGDWNHPLVPKGALVSNLVDTAHELSYVACSLGWNPKRVFRSSWSQEKAARSWIRSFVIGSRESAIVEFPTIVFDDLWRSRNRIW